MTENTFRQAVTERLHQGQWEAARRLLQSLRAPDLADLLPNLSRPERALAFRLLPRELSAEVFSALDTTDRRALLEDLTDEDTRSLLFDLAPDDRTEVLTELPGQVTQRLLNLLSPEDLVETRRLLGYPEASAGHLMTPDYVAVRPYWTIARALEHIRLRAPRSETINVIYVTDDDWVLLDDVDLRQIILADPGQTVETLMDRDYVAVSAMEDREQVVRLMRRYDLFALPVVDSTGVLVGIVTADDVLAVAEQEATEDFHRGAAVAPLRLPYRAAGILELFRLRIGWLVGLALINLASSGVIAANEEVLASALTLAFFIPLLIGTGGNTGIQAATLMVRALATGDVALHHALRVARKEVLVGLTLGLVVGAAGYLLGLLRGGPTIGLVVACSMLCIVLASNLIGILLPLILTRLRLDPAVASGPLITSVMDVAGLSIYFAVASAVLGLA